MLLSELQYLFFLKIPFCCLLYTGNELVHSPMQDSRIDHCGKTIDIMNNSSLLIALSPYLWLCDIWWFGFGGLVNVTKHSTISPEKYTGPRTSFAIISIILAIFQIETLYILFNHNIIILSSRFNIVIKILVVIHHSLNNSNVYIFRLNQNMRDVSHILICQFTPNSFLFNF